MLCHPRHPHYGQVVQDFWLEVLQWTPVLSRPWSSTSLRHLLDEKIWDPQRRVKVRKGGEEFLAVLSPHCPHPSAVSPPPFDSYKHILVLFICCINSHCSQWEVIAFLIPNHFNRPGHRHIQVTHKILQHPQSSGDPHIAPHGWEEDRFFFSIVFNSFSIVFNNFQ